MKALLKIFFFLFLQFGFQDCFAQTRHEFTHLQMGTQFRMVFYEADSAKAQRLANTCWKRLDALNLVMSDYRSDSKIMQLCVNEKVGEWYSVSEDLFHIMIESQKAAELTDGLFDITISPLTKLWRRAKRRGILPAPSQLKSTRESIGYQFIELDSRTKSIRFLKPDMRVDFGGIGKGFALDELMKILKSENVNSALLEAGGSILLSNPPPNEFSWKVNIKDKEYNLSNCGISTSGDRFQFAEIDGKRYAHILDPRTGLGFHKLHEITVIAPNATTADWSSTAAYLMSERELAKFLLSKKVLRVVN